VLQLLTMDQLQGESPDQGHLPRCPKTAKSELKQREKQPTNRSRRVLCTLTMLLHFLPRRWKVRMPECLRGLAANGGFFACAGTRRFSTHEETVESHRREESPDAVLSAIKMFKCTCDRQIGISAPRASHSSKALVSLRMCVSRLIPAFFREAR